MINFLKQDKERLCLVTGEYKATRLLKLMDKLDDRIPYIYNQYITKGAIDTILATEGLKVVILDEVSLTDFPLVQKLVEEDKFHVYCSIAIPTFHVSTLC